MIVRLDGRDPELSNDVYELHSELTSPVVWLGRRFARDFFYGALVQEGMVHCLVYRHEGETAGFLSYTENANGLFREGLKRRFFQLASILAVELVTRPTVLRDILFCMRNLSHAPSELGSDVPAEFLTFVVREKYRTPEFLKETGIRVANELFAEGVRDLRARDVKKVKSSIKTDRLLAHVFHQHQGFVRIGRTQDRGYDALIYVKEL